MLDCFCVPEQIAISTLVNKELQENMLPLPLSLKLQIIGGYAKAEFGHGSNIIQGLYIFADGWLDYCSLEFLDDFIFW